MKITHIEFYPKLSKTTDRASKKKRKKKPPESRCRAKRNVGGKAEAHRDNPSAARGRVRGDGRRGEGRRRDRGRILPEEDPPPGQPQRGPPDVRVPDLLHQAGLHADRQRRGQHSPRHPAVRSVHSKRALRVRKSRGHNHTDTQERSPHIRQRARRNRAPPTQDWLPGHPRQESRIQVQPSRPRCVALSSPLLILLWAGLFLNWIHAVDANQRLSDLLVI